MEGNVKPTSYFVKVIVFFTFDLHSSVLTSISWGGTPNFLWQVCCSDFYGTNKRYQTGHGSGQEVGSPPPIPASLFVYTLSLQMIQGFASLLSKVEA